MDTFIIRKAVFKVLRQFISTIIIGSQVRADFRLFIHILISWYLVISEERQMGMVLSDGQVNILRRYFMNFCKKTFKRWIQEKENCT